MILIKARLLNGIIWALRGNWRQTDKTGEELPQAKGCGTKECLGSRSAKCPVVEFVFPICRSLFLEELAELRELCFEKPSTVHSREEEMASCHASCSDFHLCLRDQWTRHWGLWMALKKGELGVTKKPWCLGKMRQWVPPFCRGEEKRSNI